MTIHPPQPWPDGHTSLSEISARQHGLVTRAQLRALGWSARRIDGALRSGWLVRVHPGVYAVGLVPLGPHGRTLAAVLACGPDAVLSHRSAAALWGLIAGGQARWDVLVPARPADDADRAMSICAERGGSRRSTTFAAGTASR